MGLKKRNGLLLIYRPRGSHSIGCVKDGSVKLDYCVVDKLAKSLAFEAGIWGFEALPLNKGWLQQF